jgi:hypothetical protein
MNTTLILDVEWDSMDAKVFESLKLFEKELLRLIRSCDKSGNYIKLLLPSVISSEQYIKLLKFEEKSKLIVTPEFLILTREYYTSLICDNLHDFIKIMN